MARKLSGLQQAKVAVLETFPPKFDQIHRLIEEMASLRVDEVALRRLCRNLDEMKAAASSIGEGALAETLGVMRTLAKRGGGVQMRIAGLRESFGALKTNFDGAMRLATREEDQVEIKDEDILRPLP